MKLLILFVLVAVALAGKTAPKHSKAVYGGQGSYGHAGYSALGHAGSAKYGKHGYGGHAAVHHRRRRDVQLVEVKPLLQAVAVAPAPSSDDLQPAEQRGHRFGGVGLLGGLLGGFGGHGGHGGFGHGGFGHGGFSHGGFGHGDFHHDFDHHHHHHHDFDHHHHHF